MKNLIHLRSFCFSVIFAMTGLLMSDPPVVKADPVEMARTELDAANQQLNDFKANNPQPEPPIGEDRIWFAAKGDYTFHGRAVDIRDDIVTLRASEGGRTVDLPIARLDEKHHEEIAELFADYQQASSNWQKKCQMLEEAVERQKKTLEKLSLEEAERERQRVAVVEENANHADALNIDLQRPGDREFIRDLADLIDPEDEEQIRQLCDQLLTDKATPIIVITINSMANHGGAGMRIETFATLLFDQWGIGHAKLGDQEWNTGILLLVSKNDRKARIELGGGWGRRQDELCRQIMDEQIVFHFKQGQFSEGIVAGVNALDKMGRQLSLPTAPKPSWYYPAMIALLGLAVFTAVSLVRRGSSGWAWVFFGVVFAFLFMLLRLMAQSSGGGDGGSFGEGSSGGGGATGSW